MTKKLKEKSESFESKIKRLEEIVQTLEDGTISLDDSIKIFEEGIEISNFCFNYLNNAEKKIKQLVKDKDGKSNLIDFK